MEGKAVHLRACILVTSCWLGMILSPAGDAAATLSADVQPFTLSAGDLLAIAQEARRDERFPGVMLLDSQRFDFDAEQRLTRSVHRVYRFDALKGAEPWSQLVAAWDPDRQDRPQLRARVVTPDGAQHDLDPATLSSMPLIPEDPRLFDDMRLLRAPLPAISAGSVVESLVVLRDREPLFAAGLSLDVPMGMAGPVHVTRIVATAPSSVPLRHTTRLLPEARVSKTSRGERHEIVLDHGPLAIDFEAIPEAAGDQPVVPAFLLSTGESWSAVAAEYYRITEPLIRPDEVRSILPEATSTERADVIAALLEVLHERVRYTGILFGQGRLVPRPPAITLQRRYGDCKDKAVMLVSMLRAAGLPAQLALLNAGTGVDLDPGQPGIGAFNHVIAYVPGDPDLWIDPTAEHLAIGDLPYVDAGRWALLIGGAPESLRRTPAARPADRLTVETREIRLMDYGAAKVSVQGQARGENGAYLRRLSTAPGDADRQYREQLLLDAYEAKVLDRYGFGDGRLNSPMTFHAELAGSSLGHTDFNDAHAKVRLAGLFVDMPRALRSDDKPAGNRASADGGDGANPSGARTADWVFEPYITEWQVKVTAPTGFRALALPTSGVQRFGPASLSQHYEVDSGGNVLGTIRFDTGPGRYTVAEADAFRRAYKESSSEAEVEVRFEHEAKTLLARGDAAGALRRHAELTAAHPNSAIHRLRASLDLLALGLVDEARAQARRATQIEPDSLVAFSRLGWILQFDEFGRRFGAGFDRAGSIQAYREAIRLLPPQGDSTEGSWVHVNLASVAERAEDGIRYGGNALLDLAIEHYREYLSGNPDREDVNEMLILCLWHAKRYDEIPPVAARIANNATAAAIDLAARVMRVGVDAALRDTLSRGDARSLEARLPYAAAYLGGRRHYDLARRLVEAGGVKPTDDWARRWLLVIGIAQRMEDLPAPPSTALGAAEGFLRATLRDDLDAGRILPWLSAKAKVDDGGQWLATKMAEAGQKYVRFGKMALGMQGDIIEDFVQGSLDLREQSVGSDAARISVTSGGGEVTVVYVVREDKGWRVLSSSPFWHPLGREVLARLESEDLEGARTWLDAVRTDLETDDRTATSGVTRLLARAWPRQADTADATAIRLAAYALIVQPDQPAVSLEEVRNAAAGAVTPEQRSVWNSLVSSAAWANQDVAAMIESAEALVAAEPASEAAKARLARAFLAGERWRDAERIARQELEANPNDEPMLRLLSRALSGQGRVSEGLEEMRRLVEQGRATPDFTNEFAWQALVADAVDDAALQAAQSAHRRFGGRNAATANTLACLYAASGKVQEAHNLFLETLEELPWVDRYDDGNSLLRGLVAEHAGVTQVARKIYGSIQPPPQPYPGSPFDIAVRRLERLAKSDP